jgi:hypothetical protein
MSTYVFVYRTTATDYSGGDPDSIAAWGAWFQGISDHVVELGKPVFSRRELGAAPGNAHLGGYSVISAADFDEAVRLAEGCPALSSGGGVEIGELTDVPTDATVGVGTASNSAM